MGGIKALRLCIWCAFLVVKELKSIVFSDISDSCAFSSIQNTDLQRTFVYIAAIFSKHMVTRPNLRSQEIYQNMVKTRQCLLNYPIK